MKFPAKPPDPAAALAAAAGKGAETLTDLMRQARDHVEAGTFRAFKDDFISRYQTTKSNKA